MSVRLSHHGVASRLTPGSCSETDGLHCVLSCKLCVDCWDVMHAELGTVMDTKTSPQVNCTEAEGNPPVQSI